MNEINVEAIMKEIREEIRERDLKESDLSFEDIKIDTNFMSGSSGDRFDPGEFERDVTYLNENWSIPVDMPYYTNNGFFNHIKKIIKHMTKFLIHPLVNAQNSYNASVTRSVNQLRANMIEKNNKIKDLEARIEELEKSIKK